MVFCKFSFDDNDGLRGVDLRNLLIQTYENAERITQSKSGDCVDLYELHDSSILLKGNVCGKVYGGVIVGGGEKVRGLLRILKLEDKAFFKDEGQ